MQGRTEEFLNLLLWSAELLGQPTFRNLTGSYESWAYRRGLIARAARLEKRGLLERRRDSGEDRLYRLTEVGRLHALGGRDPADHWSRSWDGCWRLALFDVPVDQNARRARLRRYLRSRAFGCLQGSVWVTPDPVQTERGILAGGKVNVASLILLEARPASGESDTEIVSCAWDFETINGRYARHQEILAQRPTTLPTEIFAARHLLRWAATEREAWLDAVTRDPLLPERLLPAGYRGREAWMQRRLALAQAGHLIQTFAG